MDIVGKSELWSVSSKGASRKRLCFNVRRGSACGVSNFLALATQVAKLQFKNPGLVLLFRGQSKDHMRKTTKYKIEHSSLMPKIFRPGDPLDFQFKKLKRAGEILVEFYRRGGFPEIERLVRQRILRWSILQHYEVCNTPLLDVTQSLRVAASFASDGTTDKGFIYVLGVPNISGAITASAEAGLQIVRLASVCPPTALRPHIQEGYLLGEYPEMAEPEQKENYGNYEIDFGRRLVAKFQFNPASFWEHGAFPKVSRIALYPNADDPLYRLTQMVRTKLDEEF